MSVRAPGGAATILSLWVLGLAAAPGVGRAAEEAAGTAAASFLSVGAGASVLSMGGATLASGADLAAASWNPATLARVDALQFAITHAPLPGGASQEWLAAGGRVGAEWRWGAQALFHREAGIEGRDAANNPTGEVSASDLGMSVHVARRFAGVLDVGVGAEWVREALAATSGSGVAFSGGIRTEVGPLGLALAARHVGGGIDYSGVRYDLPAVLAGGVSFEDPVRGLRVAVDLESPTHYYRSLRVGGEWLWRGQLALRAGYRSEIGNADAARLSGATFGMGAGLGAVWMDYAFTPEGGTGAGEHRVGLTFRPGVPVRVAQGAPASPASPTAGRTSAVTPASPPSARPPRAAASAESREAPGIVTATTPPAAASSPVPPTPAPTPVVGRPATAVTPAATSSTPVPPTPAPTPVVGRPATAVTPAATSSTTAPSLTAGAEATPAVPRSAAASVAGTPPPAASAAARAPDNTTAAAKGAAPGATASATGGKASPPPAAKTALAKPAASAAPVADSNAPGRVPGSSAPVTLAATRPAVEAVVPPAPRPARIVVAEGETLASLARRWNTSVAAIMMANDLVNEKVAPGRSLRLPPPTRR